ncbi:MAG: hypothetical protein E7606_02685 [Ruminococcaceae bacterium]|nr:hypothetical protein [Oscillospiraceae bacterium]
MTNIKNRLYIFSTTILAVLLSVLHAVALCTAYDGSVGYFDGTPLVVTMQILYALVAVWCLVIPFLTAKESTSAAPPTFPMIFTGYFSGILFLFSGILLLRSALASPSTPMLVYLLAIFTLLAAPFFLTVGKKAHAALGFLALGFLFCLLFYVYFDMYVTINSPLKVALQLSILSALLFVLCEIRRGIGKPMPRITASARHLCVLFCLPTSVAHLVFGASDACGTLERSVISPVFSLPLLALALFALSEMLFEKRKEKICKTS